ncbi:hypothetical protein DFP74_1110 [Nocardiopsis sp. Huas11]|nr:hypothetical protein DFP74_1110 [Nocardiopsis sp. Huas11]
MILVALAALAVLVGVVYVALGKGGRLARFEADYPPLDLPEDGPVTAPDLNRLVLPLALWGYHVRAVDELLVRLAGTLRAREERIQELEWRLSRLDPSYVPEGTGPGHRTRLPGDAYAPESGAAPAPDEASEPGAGRAESAHRPDTGDGPRAVSRTDAESEPGAAPAEDVAPRSGSGAGPRPEPREATSDLREQA